MNEGVIPQLRDAIEMAFHYARSAARTSGEAAVPAAIRPLLGFSRLPERAREIVRDVVDEDDDFREQVLAEVVETDVGELGWLWLKHEQGWEHVLSRAEVGAAEDLRIGGLETELRKTGERLEKVEQSRNEATELVERMRVRLEGSEERRAVADARVGELEQQVRSLETALGAARSRATELDRRATRAEENLGAERRRSREVEERQDIPTQSAEQATSASQVLAEKTQRRRIPFRSGRGLHDDSAAGLAELLAMERVRVFVDGYNVAMLGWPMVDLAMKRRRLIDALSNYLLRSDLVIDVVFDGADFGGGGDRSTSSNVRLSWSPADVTADDVIIDRVEGLAVDIAVVVITDDRDVRSRASDRGCNIAGSRALLGLLDRAVPPRS